jgi:hypothetical protein
MAPLNPRAAQVADQFLERALPGRTRYFNDDDRMCAHYLYDWMQAYLDFSPVRSAEPLNTRAPIRRYFPKARIYVHCADGYHAVANLGKGAVLKVTGEGGTIHSDTGLIGRNTAGQVIVSHIVDDNEVACDAERGVVRAKGVMCRRKAKLATPVTQVIFRMVNLTLGRFAPNLLRSLLQKVLITGKRRTEYGFEREIEFHPGRIVIRNRITRPAGAPAIESLHLASDATSIYVANSNVYQRSVLHPWRELRLLRDRVNAAGAGEETVEVAIPAPPAAQGR